MIRESTDDDMDEILAIWLDASIKAHDFIDAEYWRSQLDNMRNIYLPASETYVYEGRGELMGFYSLVEDRLAALFVSPAHQGRGIGTALLSHAKALRRQLSLSVYEENVAGYSFYLSRGFVVVSEQLDEHTGHKEYTMTTHHAAGSDEV
jgi:putative acetyltransferase